MKHEYPCKKGVPSYSEPKIFPQEGKSTKGKAIDKSMFSSDKLGSEVSTKSNYKSSTGSMVNKSVHSYKENNVGPTSNY